MDWGLSILFFFGGEEVNEPVFSIFTYGNLVALTLRESGENNEENY